MTGKRLPLAHERDVGEWDAAVGVAHERRVQVVAEGRRFSDLEVQSLLFAASLTVRIVDFLVWVKK